MAYCHECGSEITKDDVFCPYCGISLEQMPEEAEDILAENPIANSASQESGAGFGVSQAKKFDAADKKEILADDKAIRVSGEVAQNTLNDKITGSNLPAPTERKSTEADVQGNPLVNQSNLPEVPLALDENEKLEAVENQNESSLMSYEEAEVEELPDAKEPENSFNKESEIKQNDDFDLTIPYFPSAVKSAGAKAEPQNANKKEMETSAVSEFPISKPEIKLESPESQCPPPRVDSVQIMQPPILEEKSSPEKNDENEFNAVASDKPIVENSPPKVASPAEDKQGRSFTTPNIGGTETDGKKSAKLKPLDEGTVLNGRYEIVRKIGGGGMGAVYLASDKNLGGVLRAVKEMVQSYIEEAQQDKAVSDFKRESLLLTSLEHNSIPTIYDYFFDEKEARFYLVMKYISGGDLASRLRSAPEGRIDEKSITEWGIQIADVLDYLHNRQPPIVYRDLKPANIMVDGNSGRAMLIDFGIARWINKEEKGVTAVGTMGYAPPELFSGNVEPRSDIYSLGSTMFHLLTGADPQSNPLLIFDFQKHPRPRQINSQLSDQMEKILMRAVEYSADKRFDSAAELRRELEKHLENLKSGKVTFGVKEAPASVALSEQPVFCGFCGRKIVATDMFCAFCGAKQPLAQQGVHSLHNQSKLATAQLLIVGTNELETPSFAIEKDENLLGRRDPMSNIFPEVDLSKYDPQTKISRRHARIRREGKSFLIEDLGSSNGTIVIPVVSETVRLLPHKPYILANGDKVRLGDTTLHFISG